MPNQSLSSKDGGGGLLILEADHKLAERQLLEGTRYKSKLLIELGKTMEKIRNRNKITLFITPNKKIPKPVNKRINGGK